MYCISQDDLNIGLTLFNNSSIDFKIIDLSGKEVFKKHLGYQSSGTHAFEIKNINLDSGVYIYLILSDALKLHSGRVVVK